MNIDAKVQPKDEGFKDAWHESLHDPSGAYPQQLPIKALASIATVSATHLYATADKEEDKMPSMQTYLAVLPNLKNLAVLDFQERLVGRVAFRIPDHREVCGAQMGAALKEFGEFVMEASIGEWTPEKIARIEKEGREAMASIAAIVECVKQQAHPPRDLRAVSGGAR